MKCIEACLKLYDNKYDHTNRNTGCQPSDINNRVVPVTAQAPECGLEIISEHA
jgi:hypothetical protein